MASFLNINTYIQDISAREEDYFFEDKLEWVLSEKQISFLSKKELSSKEDFEPTHTYLLDNQFYQYGNFKARYSKFLFHIINVKGLEDASPMSIAFMPKYEKIAIHEITIIRGSTLIDCKETSHYRIHQSERVNNAERYHSYSTLEVYLNDIRVGDIISYSYSIYGGDPALIDHLCFTRLLGFYHSISNIRVRVVTEQSRKLYYKSYNQTLAPKIQNLDNFEGLKEYLWETSCLEPFIYEEDVPAWYSIRPWLQVTDFENWEQVRDFYREFYRWTSSEDPLFLSIAEDIAHNHTDPIDKIVACIDFSQKSIRYESFKEIDLTVKPAEIQVILQNRFGDCKDKTIVLLSLLRYFRFEASAALVSVEDPYKILEALPSVDCFDHIIVYLTYNGHDYWIDPTQTWQSGTLDHRITYNRGGSLVLHESFLNVIEIPENSFEEIIVDQCFDFREAIAGDSLVQLIVQSHYRGALAERIRSDIHGSTISELSKCYETFYKKIYPTLRQVQKPVIHDDNINNTIIINENYVLEFDDIEKNKLGRNFSAHDLQSFISLKRYVDRLHPLSIRFPLKVRQAITILYRDQEQIREQEHLFNSKTTQWFKAATVQYQESGKYIWEGEYETLASYVLPEDYFDYERARNIAYELMEFAIPNWILLGKNQQDFTNDNNIVNKSNNYLSRIFQSFYNTIKLRYYNNLSPEKVFDKLSQNNKDQSAWTALANLFNNERISNEQFQSKTLDSIKNFENVEDLLSTQIFAIVHSLSSYQWPFNLLNEIKKRSLSNDSLAQHTLGIMYEAGKGVPQNYEEAVKWLTIAAKQGHPYAQNRLGLIYRHKDDFIDYKQAIKWFKAAAKQGHAYSQFCLGTIYYFGPDALRNNKRAVKWYRLAAKQGYFLAQYNLGCHYSNGEGVSLDHKEAVKWYRLAVEQGYADAQYSLGNSYSYGKGVPQDYAEAVKWYRLAAEQGDAKAQYNLGNSYSYGEGVPQDYAEAMKWYKLAAEQNYAKAQYFIGLMYEEGNGIPQSYEEAFKWYKLAAEQKYAQAQFTLGFFYDDGLGVAQDFNEALRWYRLAAEQNYDQAQYNIGVLYKEGRGVPQDYEEAVKWYRLAAEQGHVSAQYNMGFHFSEGRGVPQNFVEAARWFKLAAENNDTWAQNALAFCYKMGQGVPRNSKKAAKWYRLAAEQGYARAQTDLGIFYIDGISVAQDFKEAVKWFKLAAEQGEPQAQNNLGCHYRDGDGVAQDIKEAIKWFKLAAEQGDNYAKANLDELIEAGYEV